MKKKYLSDEDRKTAKHLGLTVHKEMVPLYYIKVEEADGDTVKTRAPRINLASQTALLTVVTSKPPMTGTMNAKVYNTAKFILKVPTIRKIAIKLIAEKLKSELTVTQVSSCITYMVRQGNITTVASKDFPSNKLRG